MRIFLLLLLLSTNILSKAQTFTHADSLRGSITPEREWWDLGHYHLDIEVFPEEQRLAGSNTITYKVLKSNSSIQVDLQTPLEITKVTQNDKELNYRRDGNAFFIQLEDEQPIGSTQTLIVYYEGKPRVAKRAPWDGGFSWDKDANGEHFIATSCQGLGASVWWPCKDHMYDEVDSMMISVEVPERLTNVSNGRLKKVEKNKKKGTRTFHWEVKNPINNYGVNVNIADYVSWDEVYKGEKGDLDITYWALRVDEAKAKKQYQDVPKMLDAFEHWFGPYPFYEDGYQLVQVPYLGMEHQSSITYGNQFMNGYLGNDLSGTGWGLKFDFIIIHESGHEWFANNITHQDMADMWLHESFTNYSESIFLEYHYGKEAGQEYVRGTRYGIQNAKPMIGPYGVNYEGYPGDVYPKGANILNTIRTVLDDDEKWRMMLRGMGEEFYHKTTNSAEVEAFMIDFLGLKLENVFDQYLRDPRLPTLEYFVQDGELNFRWTNCISTFDLPVDIMVNGKTIRLEAIAGWKKMALDVNADDITLDPNYYVSSFKTR